MHDERLCNHSLLCLQQRTVNQQRETVLLDRTTATFLRDCDIRHRRYRRCKFHIVDVHLFTFPASSLLAHLLFRLFQVLQVSVIPLAGDARRE